MAETQLFYPARKSCDPCCR